jgi:small subunit ribosomal protein S17
MGERGSRRQMQGVVVSDRMEKTVAVKVERVVKDPTFKKYIKKHMKYMAHDEKNECGVGDKVSIVESRPLSKTKRWRIQTVLEKAK